MDPKTAPLQIGDTYNGGIVYDIDEGGFTGLLATEHNLSNGEPWEQAQQACEACRDGGHADWRLPTRDELYSMYVNLAQKGIGDFPGGQYWSSTPGYGPGVYRAQTFAGDGHQAPLWLAGVPNHVRATRNFMRVSLDQLVNIPNDFFATGESTYVSVKNGQFLARSADGSIRSTGTREDAPNFDTIVENGKLHFKVNGTYLRVDANHRLVASAANAGEATAFTIWSAPSGSIVIKTEDDRYWQASDGGAVTVQHENELATSLQFRFHMKETAPDRIGEHHHFQTQAALSPCDLAMASLVWQVTGGLFLALGLGAYINSSEVRTGLLGLVQSSAAGRSALQTLVQTLGNNRKSVSAAAFAFLGSIYQAGLLWSVIKLALSAAGWWAMGRVISKILMVVLLPEAEAADLLASFTVWSANTVNVALEAHQNCR